MSRINIPFGTRMGYGEHLDEGTPFVRAHLYPSRLPHIALTFDTQSADVLCQQCSTALEKDLTYSQHDDDVLHIDPRAPSGCRLCALLTSKFCDPKASLPLRVEYFLLPRYGFFFRNDDLMFRPVGSKLWANGIVRLGLQLAKLGGTSTAGLTIIMPIVDGQREGL